MIMQGSMNKVHLKCVVFTLVCGIALVYFARKHFVFLEKHSDIYLGKQSEPIFNYAKPFFFGEKIRSFESKDIFRDSNLELFNKDDNIFCEHWAVVTTIYKASDAVRKVSQDPFWCLVIVGDKNGVSHAEYLADIGPHTQKTIVFLSPEDQDRLFPLLSSVIPWNEMSRKNIGYMYAIKHDAKMIWDFDDDNINLLPSDIVENMSKYRTPCSDFSFHIFNPYPYFDVNETYTWPRGIPLEHVRASSTVSNLCFSSAKKSIGVIQSLANIEPDVDAVYRFTRTTPFNFGATPSSHAPVMVPKNSYSPFNAQATLWMKDAFQFLALPMTVTYRVSDIWRSYIAQYFFHRMSLHLVFVPPYIDQHRNAHDYLKDFNDELDIYQKSNQLLAWLSKDAHAKDMFDLYKEMYEHGYIEEKDIYFIAAWMETFDM